MTCTTQSMLLLYCNNKEEPYNKGLDINFTTYKRPSTFDLGGFINDNSV